MCSVLSFCFKENWNAELLCARDAKFRLTCVGLFPRRPAAHTAAGSGPEGSCARKTGEEGPTDEVSEESCGEGDCEDSVGCEDKTPQSGGRVSHKRRKSAGNSTLQLSSVSNPFLWIVQG